MSDSEYYDAGYSDGINNREENSEYADNDYYAEGYELGLTDAEGRAG